jgi:hypothetical protein
MPQRPIYAVLAIVAALLPWPALKLLDHLNRGCGDGLCGFFPGLLIIGGLVIATLVFVVLSARRDETPSWLRMVPFVLWLLLVGWSGIF